MSHSIKRARLLFFASIVMLVTRHPVNGLETNETVTDDFDTGTANFWQWFSGDEQPGEDLTTLWHLSMHGDPPPYGIEAVRPPMEENGGGFLEIVPFSDSPAQIISNVFDLLPGATVEMTYWNIVPFPILERNTVLNLYIEFLNINQSDDSNEPPLRTVQVFKAPFPTDPSPGWTTVNIDLLITEPSKVQLRIDGIRRNLTTTGLAVSKVTINNGLDVSTTTTSTTSTTMSSTTVVSTVDSSTPTPTKYAVDKTTATTTTTNAPTMNEVTTLDSSDSFNTTDERSTISESDGETESVPSSSSSSSTSIISSTTSTTSVATVSPTTPIFAVSSTVIKPEMTTSSSSSSSISSTTTTPTTPTVLSTKFTSTVVSTTSTNTPTTSTNTIVPTTSTTMSSTLSTSSRTSIITSASTDSNDGSTTPLPQPGMTTNQLRDVLIGVSVSILLFFLFCFLFTIFYRRHRRRRAYLIENRQLESGIIRALELSDQIPYSPYKSESNGSSNTSTTASNRSLAPNPRAKLSIRRLLDNLRLKTNKNSSKITPLN